MSRRRVVITGLGIVSPVGNTIDEAWGNILAGRSGIDPITRFDASALSCRIAGEVKGFDIDRYIAAKEARHMDTFIHYGVAAGIQAFEDSRADDHRRERGTHRRAGRLGHRRTADDRGDLHRARGARAAAHLAVLRAGVDHQHGVRPAVDPLRHEGPELRHRQRVHDGPALHRRRGPADRVRRRRRDARRRRRVDDLAARHRRLHGGPRDDVAQRRAAYRQPAVGRRPRRLRARRGRGRDGARGVRAREEARREHRGRADRLRDELGRVSHHRAERGRPAARDA